MDAHDIFKKLTVGCTFKRKPQLQQPNLKKDVPEVKKEFTEEHNHDEISQEEPKKKKRKFSEEKIKALEEEQLNHLRNVNHISVKGKNVVRPIEAFDQLRKDYGLSDLLIKNIQKSGYNKPTPIQMQAIPAMLQGRQILACAPTGSGKTAAFLIPIIHSLKSPQKLGFRAVIVCPTRELARQTYNEANRLAEGTQLRVHLINKVQHAAEKFGSKSSQKFDLLCTTPNKLVYLLNMEPPVLNLKNVEWLVVDESDKLFEAGVRGFRDQLAVIYQACLNDKLKRAMFSATHTEELAKWCKKSLTKLVQITIGIRNTSSSDVDQELLFVGDESGKLVAFRDLIQKGLAPPILVFIQSKERAKDLYNELIYDGINVDVIHADRTQNQRENVVRAFREGKIWILICTELMGRGIDFKAVNVVINYDFPNSAISYIHKIGRVGRAGRKGKAITFFTQNDAPLLRSIAQVMRDSGCQVPEYMLQLKKIHKTDKKKLEKQALPRSEIDTTPVYEKYQAEKEKRKIKRKLKKTFKQSGGNLKKTFKQSGGNLKKTLFKQSGGKLNEKPNLSNNKVKRKDKKFIRKDKDS